MVVAELLAVGAPPVHPPCVHPPEPGVPSGKSAVLLHCCSVAACWPHNKTVSHGQVLVATMLLLAWAGNINKGDEVLELSLQLPAVLGSLLSLHLSLAPT